MTGKSAVVAARLEALRQRHATLVEHLLSVLNPSPDVDALDGTAMQTLIGNQLLALDEAHDAFEDLADDVRQTLALQSSRQFDWVEERERLSALLTEDPRRGTVRWFRQAVAAAVMFDLPTLIELLDGDLRVPDSAAVLVDRIRLLRQSLEQGDWRGSRALLSEAAFGTLGQQLDLSNLERAELALTLARLGLQAGAVDDAETWLARAAELGAGEADRHLVAAWLHRARGEIDAASASVEAASASGALPVELLVELAHQLADSSEPLSAHLPIVEAEVWALSSIDTVEIDIDRLIEPAPPTVWLSLGLRMAATSQVDRALNATNRARELTPAGEVGLLAEIDECVLDITQGSGAAANEVKDALLNAAMSRISAEHLDRALDLLDKALELVPRDPMATLLRADCVRVEVSDEPLSASRPVLESVLDAVAAVPFADDEADYSWGLLVRASAESMLCDGFDPDAWSHAWRSVEATAWAVACRPSDATRWGELVGAALELGLQQVALRASALGCQLAQGEEQERLLRDARARALATVGRLEEAAEIANNSANRTLAVALEAVAGTMDPVIDELLPRGRARNLESYEWQLFLLAMLAARDPRLPAVAELAGEEARHYPDEVSWVAIEILAELALGRPERACDITPKVHQALQHRSSTADFGAMWHGLALLIKGDVEEGGAVLRRVFGLLTAIVDGAVWRTLERPAVEHLAAINGRDLPAELLAELDEIANARTSRLAARDVDDELDDFELGGPDPAEARRIMELVRAVMRLLDGDPEPIVEHSRLAWPSENDARPPLVEARARDGARKLRAAQLAAELGDVGDSEQRGRQLQEVLALDSLDADVYLRNAALPDPIRVEVGRELVAVASGDSDQAAAASFVLSYLNWPDAPDPLDKASSPWRLQLPPSWFDGDDLLAHPLFTWAIPTVQSLRDLPAINVTTDAELEPDRYVIAREDSVLDDGRAPESARWLPTNDLSIVPGWTPGEAASPTSPWLVVAPPADDGDPVGQWSTASTYEMLVRRVAVFAAPAGTDTQSAATTDEPAVDATTFGDVITAGVKWLLGRGRQR